jgi:hypothetical protein
MNTACKRTDSFIMYVTLLLISAVINACGADGPIEENEYNPAPYVYQTGDWDRYDIINLEGTAAINPNIHARLDDDGRVHIFYYRRGETYQGNQTRYQIHHLVWDPLTVQPEGEEEIIAVQPPNPGDAQDSGLNNCLVLETAMDRYGYPVVAYQGGDIPQADDGTICNLTAQGDLMINRQSGALWEEYLGIMGDASQKNPYFTDGYVGVAASIAVDGEGAIHMCGQHYYEFCDWTSTNYPDLLYVRQSPDQLGHYSTGREELVDDYNIFDGGGGVQSDMGYHCKLVLDTNDNPYIFYVGTPIQDGIGEDRRMLRMASKSGEQWIPEPIEILDGWDVAWLSAAMDADGRPAVAYFMQNVDPDGDYPDHLRYAWRDNEGQWHIAVVDNASQCGNHCSLAFDSRGNPAIAYYDLSARSATYRIHKDLKFAYFDGAGWQTETVATAGDIGQYNTLWFDAEGFATVCTYELNEQEIVILRRRNH